MFNVITGAADAAARAVRYAIVSRTRGSAGFRVEPERVYELANRFDEIADKIQSRITDESRALWVAAPGADKPSTDAADRLTATSFGDAGLITRLDAYTTELRSAATSLRNTARQYGLTDHTESGRLGAADV
jgi:hypothetical protein